MDWAAPTKPAEFAETCLIDAILDGQFPIDSALPGERELAARLGVTRPTLREALQRVARDGWIEIRHGKPTRVRNYWQEGSLGVLAAIARRPQHLPQDFIAHLLQVRLVMAPGYTRQAVERCPQAVAARLLDCLNLPDDPAAYAAADWEIHYFLTQASGNPVFTLILNGFRDLYPPMACVYFQAQDARRRSLQFYRELHAAAQEARPAEAEDITRQVMVDSLTLWRAAQESLR